MCRQASRRQRWTLGAEIRAQSAESERRSRPRTHCDARRARTIHLRLLRRIALILLTVVGCVLLFAAVLIGALRWYMTPPSDASLERRFYKQRADFERLVRMMEEDVHMQRVADDFTRNDDWDAAPLKQRQISEQRWNQYRECFRRAGVPMGTASDEANDIEILVWAAGLAIAGRSLSYVHCENKTAHNFSNSYEPCFEHKESGSFDGGGHVIRYKRIEGDWYIFDYSN